MSQIVSLIVHGVMNGKPLCRFSPEHQDFWPEYHRTVSAIDPTQAVHINCAGCQKIIEFIKDKKIGGAVRAICIAPTPGAPMQSQEASEAIAGRGLKGDRYGEDIGSFQRGDPSKRQVSFMNDRFFDGTVFDFTDCRRNIITEGVELLWLIDSKKEFVIGTAVFRAVKYLDPCNRPSMLSGKPGFKETFVDTGAIIAEVVQSGTFSVGDAVFHESKNIDHSPHIR
jgi:hypothetical protein